MNKLHLFGVLIASAALAACGGGEDDSAPAADPAGTPDAGVEETAAPEAEAGETMDAAGDMAGDAADAAGEMAGDAADAAGDMAGDAADAAGEMAGDAMDAAGDMAEPADAGAAFTVAGLTGDAEAGRRVFARCRSCHVLEEGVNRTGPSLYGIFGREAGTVEGFRYSDANANSGITWTGEVMFEYLENPREYIPGTFMAFPGLRDPQDRADVIAYIKDNGGLGE